LSGIAATYAGLVYYDRTLALKTGEVVPDGVDLAFAEFRHPLDFFGRQCQSAEWEVSELSASSFLAMTGQGDDRFVGLPVFVSRYFRQSQVYVNQNAVSAPEDLVGKKVGIPEYQMTAGVWVRGILQDEFGVRPEQLRWFTGGLWRPGYHKRNDIPTPPGLSLQVIPEDRTLEGLLDSGELDALVSVQPPRSFNQPGSPVQRLFPDYRAVERDYYRRTGIFPIMHLVVLRRDVYEANPWVARSLFDAFCRAKDDGYRRMRTLTALAVSLPWLVSDLDEVDELFGGDAFPYGVAANRHVLQELARYEAEQGLSPREIGVEEMFVPELLET
jgi:4,5-dihydroxyphthalate decarboxylase